MLCGNHDIIKCRPATMHRHFAHYTDSRAKQSVPLLGNLSVYEAVVLDTQGMRYC